MVLRAVYATSPGTKATIASLISTVHSLQNDLTAARSALVDLEATVAHLPAPQSPKLSKAEILALVDAKIDDYRSELDERVERLSVEMQAMEERSLGTKEGFVDEVLAVQDATKEWKDALEGVVSEFRQDVSTRLSALEHSPAAVQRSPIRQLQLPAPSPSYSDAPPTKSMTAFSSPSPTRSLTRSPGGRSLSLVPTSARKSPRKLSNLALPSHLVYPRSPRPTAAPESPVGPSTRALGKRTRDSDASDLSIEVLLSPPTRREEGGGMMAALFSTEKEVGHVRKRVRVNDDAASSSEEGDSFDQSTEMSRSSIRADVVVQTKSGDETPSTSDPSFFSSSRLSLPSTSLPAPLAARKSLPMATLPFPLVSPFKRPTLSPFGELSNASPKKGKVPPTPEAKRTLYGTEEESRFEDLVSAEEEFASPVKSAGKQQWARLGAWGGFGGK